MNCIFAAVYWAKGERGRCLRIFFFLFNLGLGVLCVVHGFLFFIFRFLGVGLMLGYFLANY